MPEARKKVTPRSTKLELWDAYNNAVSQVKGEVIEKIEDGPAVESIRSLSDSKIKLNSEIDKLSQTLLSSLNDYSLVLENISKKKKELLSSFDNQKNVLIVEMEQVKNGWEEEKRIIAEENDRVKAGIERDRKREEEEYQYSLMQKRKKEANEYAEIVQKKRDELQKREDDISLKEKEIAEMRKAIDSFPAELEKQVKSALAVLEIDLKSKFDCELKELKQAKEHEANLATVRIANLDGIIKSHEVEVKELKDQLASVNRIMKEMAVAAIDAKSNKNILIEKKND